jgi:hypothetical protein
MTAFDVRAARRCPCDQLLLAGVVGGLLATMFAGYVFFRR